MPSKFDALELNQMLFVMSAVRAIDTAADKATALTILLQCGEIAEA